MSMRLASSKATEVFRRIGSMKERGYKKGSYSLQEAACASKLSLQGLDDDVAQQSYTTDHNPFGEGDRDDGVDGERAQSPEAEAERESPRLERALAASSITNGRASPVADNPDGIREYLASIGKAHLKADLLGHVKIPIKVKWSLRSSPFHLTVHALTATFLLSSHPLPVVPLIPSPSPLLPSSPPRDVVGFPHWTTESWFPSDLPRPFHLYHCLIATHSPPLPLSPLSPSPGTCTSFTRRGGLRVEVDVRPPAADLLLKDRGVAQDLASRGLVLTRVKPLDPGLLLPLLKGVRDNLVARRYVTTQRREICTTLSSWVRHVLTKEFEMLHTSFPSTSLLVELPRLENYLRCFHTVEYCYELRKPFEHELSTQGLPACVTDLLLAALSKHVDTWIDALYKEELKSAPSASESREVVLEVPTEWQVWQESFRRAGLLTNPILNFLAISMHTYQPILMIEMGVDYLYLVMPKLLTAAQMLVKPLLDFDVDEGIQLLQKEEVLPPALKSAWMLCDNLSEINKLTVKSDLPQHLIPQEYRHSFSSGLTHWLALSKHLAFGELEREVDQDEFVALEDSEGFSQSAVGMVDLLRALMKRLSSVSWPGGVGPSVETMDTIAGHLLELVLQYKARVTEAYTRRGGCTDKISVEVCVVVRNVEHVCDETRKHLLQLSSMCVDSEGHQKSLDLTERSKQLQSYIDDSAEELLKTCLPHLEQILEKGVTKGGPESVQKGLEEALHPVEDRLYFAEPLLHELWVRLFRHAILLKEVYVKSGWRERLRRLREVLTKAHTFLTDHQGVGFPSDAGRYYRLRDATRGPQDPGSDVGRELWPLLLRTTQAAGAGVVQRHRSLDSRQCESWEAFISSTYPLPSSSSTYSSTLLPLPSLHLHPSIQSTSTYPSYPPLPPLHSSYPLSILSTSPSSPLLLSLSILSTSPSFHSSIHSTSSTSHPLHSSYPLSILSTSPSSPSTFIHIHFPFLHLSTPPLPFSPIHLSSFPPFPSPPPLPPLPSYPSTSPSSPPPSSPPLLPLHLPSTSPLSPPLHPQNPPPLPPFSPPLLSTPIHLPAHLTIPPSLSPQLAFTEAGLRVHVIQAPGQHRGVLVKARVEPKYWFARSEPQKTHLVKEDPACSTSPEVLEDVPDAEQGGVLTLQLRTPKMLGNSVVHSEAIVPLRSVPRVSREALSGTHHVRITLTRPWNSAVAVASLKDLAERWEPGDRSSQIQETQKIRATFARAGSMKSPSSASGKGARRPHGGSMRLGSVK
ncbi:hypothetical protein C7M84_009410 [Penaeus vannamei]|uniref:MHD1 domain-containing protein n=1 Tax=Penaeus vannamei TaxID=6689 RepID=A0A3R7M561_PENVA|nr:hypothetical protein C7M84_009410 [Penaeus vannamei]